MLESMIDALDERHQSCLSLPHNLDAPDGDYVFHE